MLAPPIPRSPTGTSRFHGLIVGAGLLLVGLFLATAEYRTWPLAANTVLLAGSVTAIAVPLGALLAVLAVRTDVRGRGLAAMILGILLFLPLYVQLCGWEAIFGRLGWQTVRFGQIALPLLSGMSAAIWIHAAAAIPWAALIVGVGLSRIDPALEESALLDAPASRVLLHVTLPQCGSFFLAACIWIFVSVAGEMTVTNIYQVRTYAEETYNVFAGNEDLATVGVSLAPGITLLALLVMLAWSVLDIAFPGRTDDFRRAPVVYRLGSLQLPATAIVWLVVLLLAGVPLASLCYRCGETVTIADDGAHRGWSLVKLLQRVIAAPYLTRRELVWTYAAAAASASLATSIGLALAWKARQGGAAALPAWLATGVGLAMPGPIVGVSIIWLLASLQGLADGNAFARHAVHWLGERSIIPPALAQLFRGLPMALLILAPALRNLSSETLAAAQLDGIGPWGLLPRIAIPQRLPAIFAAWLAALVVSAGDLGCSVLIRAGQDSLPRLIFGWVHSGADDKVAASCLASIALYAAATCAIRWLLRTGGKPLLALG